MGVQWLDASDTVDGASKQIRGIGRGLRVATAAGDVVAVDAPDSPLVTFHAADADPLPFPMPLDALDATSASFPLWSNGYWNTNYPSFLPSDALHADWAWRFSLDFGGDAPVMES